MIPQNLQGVLWNVGTEKLDEEKDKSYIINQVLAYGSLEHLRWLLKTYPKKDIVETFLRFPAKDYTPAAYNFVRNILLKIKDSSLDQRKYVRSLPRLIG